MKASSALWREQLAATLKQWHLVGAHDHPWHSGRVVMGHAHVYYQMDYITKGTGQVVISGRSYAGEAGDLYITNPRQEHAFEAAERDPMNLITLKFQPEKLDDWPVFPNKVTNLRLLSRNQQSEFESMLRHCSIEKNSGNTESAQLADALLEVCLALLLRYLKDLEDVATDDQTDACERALTYIERRYNHPLTLADLARIAGLSPTYFSQKFSAQMGHSPLTALARVRIDVAKRLLANTSLSISEVGIHVGYPDAYHFSHRFKEITGVSPSQFRRAASPPAGSRRGAD